MANTFNIDIQQSHHLSSTIRRIPMTRIVLLFSLGCFKSLFLFLKNKGENSDISGNCHGMSGNFELAQMWQLKLE